MLSALGEWFGRMLMLSAAASVVALLILLVRMPLKNRLHPRWTYLLWSLLLLKLILPWTPESPISIYNWLPGGVYKAEMSAEGTENGGSKDSVIDAAVPEAAQDGLENDADHRSEAAAPESAESNSAVPGGLSAASAAQSKSEPAAPQPAVKSAAAFAADERAGLGSVLLQGFALLWLLGAAAALAFGLSAHARFAARLRRDSAAPPPEAERLLQACRREMRLRRPVRLTVTGQVGVPTLLGAVRPRLLLPPEVLSELDESQLRHVMLHELAHVKRLDVHVNMLAALLTALHGFNPLLAYAFRRMREDQEVACDAFAMSRLAPEERIAYGRTILQLLESMTPPVSLPGAVGLSGGKTELKRRLSLIATPRIPTYRSAILGLSVMLLLGGCTLTGAELTEPSSSDHRPLTTHNSGGSAPQAQKADSAAVSGQTLFPGAHAIDSAETLLVEENSIRVTSRETSEGGETHLIHVQVVNDDQGYGRSYLWESSNDPGHPPQAEWADVNDDGVKEIVIILGVGSSTGQALQDIHVLDPYSLEEREVADYRDLQNNKFTVGPVREYGGRLYMQAGLNGRYIARVYDDSDPSWQSVLHYWGAAEYEIVNDRIVAHAYGKLSDTKFPVKVTVTYGPDLKPADTVMNLTGEIAPPFSRQEIRERMDGQMGTAQREMSEHGGLYRFEETNANTAHSSMMPLNYGVNPDTGTIYDAVKGGPIGTLTVIDGASPPDLSSLYEGERPRLSDLYNEAYDNKLKQLLQPILTASGLKKDGENWIAGFSKDGYVLANVIRGEDKLTIKADLFTGMWEEASNG